LGGACRLGRARSAVPNPGCQRREERPLRPNCTRKAPAKRNRALLRLGPTRNSFRRATRLS
jgi:hypothetical protein